MGTAGRIETNGASPETFFSRFRERYDESASDPITELGVFYERNRGVGSGLGRPRGPMLEYTDVEWTHVLSVFLSRLAREFGMYQTWEYNGRSDLAWFRHDEEWRLNTLIAQANTADVTVLDRDVPALLASGAALAVLVLYPDYPLPSGTRDLAEAEVEWRKRLENSLAHARPSMAFLVLMISSQEWGIPAPWAGSKWDPAQLRLIPFGD